MLGRPTNDDFSPRLENRRKEKAHGKAGARARWRKIPPILLVLAALCVGARASELPNPRLALCSKYALSDGGAASLAGSTCAPGDPAAGENGAKPL